MSMRRKVVLLATVCTVGSWLGCAAPGRSQNDRLLNEDPPMFQTEHSWLGWPSFGTLQTASAQHEAGDRESITRRMPTGLATTAPATRPADEPSVRGLDRSHWTRVTIAPASGAVRHHPIYFRDLDLGPTAARLAAGVDGGGAGVLGGSAGMTDTGTPTAGARGGGGGTVAIAGRSGGAVSERAPSAVDLGTADPTVAAARAELAGAAGPFSTPEAAAAAGSAGSSVPVLNPTQVAAANQLESQLNMSLGAGSASLGRAQAAGIVLQPIKFAFDLVVLPVRAVVQPPWSAETTVGSERIDPAPRTGGGRFRREVIENPEPMW